MKTTDPACVPEQTRHEEADTITKFLDTECQRKCCKRFPRHHYELIHSQCAELTREMLDMVVIGQVMALTTQLGSTIYMHQGEKVKEFILYNSIMITCSLLSFSRFVRRHSNSFMCIVHTMLGMCIVHVPC